MRRKFKTPKTKRQKEKFRRKLRSSEERVLRFLSSVEKEKYFDYGEAFEKVFGFKPKDSVFMQKGKGCIIFYLSERDYAEVMKGRSPFEIVMDLGRVPSREYVKENRLKERVIIVKRGKRDIERTVKHEEGHVVYGLLHPMKKWRIEKQAENAVLSEFYADLVSHDDRVKIKYNLIFDTLIEPGGKPLKNREEHLEKLRKIEKLYSELYNKGVSNREIAEVVLHSTWSNIEQNLKRLLKKKV